MASALGQRVPQSQSFECIEKGFLENKGQVKDATGKINHKVLYNYSNGIFNLELKQNGFSYELFQVVDDNGAMGESGQMLNKDDDDVEFNSRLSGSSRVDVVLDNANRRAVIESSNPTGAHFNFYSSPVITNRIENVAAYNTITYRDIYPGIDLVFNAPDKEEGTSLRYDFIVHAGADPSLIQLKYNGNRSIDVAENGAVRITTAFGYVEEGKPVSFQNNDQQEIATAYKIEKNVLSFHLADYDRTQMLTIDPTLIWATYYGGPNVEDVAKVTTDKLGRPIIAGNTKSLTKIASTGAFQTVYGGGPSDLFVAKFKTNGNLDWASYFGGDGKDLGYGAVADKYNNVILYGKAASEGLATTGQMNIFGSGECVLAKFTPNGTLIWSTYKGGGGDDHFRNVRVDFNGNLYCAGYTESIYNIATPGAYQTSYGGSGDCILSKFSPDGQELWSTYFGGDGADRFHAVNLDLFGHILLNGTTGTTAGMATEGVHQTIYGGGEEDVLLAEFDTSGNRIWSTYYGGEYSDRGRGVESDSLGNIYIGGLTESETGIATPGAHQEHWTPGFIDTVRQEDGYVAKFTPTGQLVWGTYYGGSGYDRIWGITLDRALKGVFVAGGTQSDDSIATPDAWQTTRAFGTDGFFARWDFDGNLVWGSYWGGKSEDHLQDVEPDGNGFIYVLGVTNQNHMPITVNVFQPVSSGNDESMLDRFYAGRECYDISEPNNTFATASQIVGWTPLDTFYYGYSGSIVNKADQDWYKLKVKSVMHNFMVILKDKPNAYNLKLYNSQQVLLKSSSNPPNVNDTIIFNNAPAAYYYIRVVHGKSSYDSLNCYRLIIYQSNDVIFSKASGDDNFSEQEAPLSKINVYPNPVTDELSFGFSAPSPVNGSLLIYDMLGRLCYTEEVELEEGYQTRQINVSNLPDGSYQLLLKSREKNWVASFLKAAN